MQTQRARVDGAWTVDFQPDRGAPPSISLDSLSSWSTNSDPVVKYFSGIGIVWHPTYRVDATDALKLGKNEISIKVINAWVNRLIGDQQPNATRKYTFTTEKPYKADSPLLPSGLLGPVTFEIIS